MAPEQPPEPDPRELDAALIYAAQEQYRELESLARSITVRFPEFGRGWKALGVALMCQGRAEEALAPLRRCVELSPDDRDAHKNLGNALQRLGKLSEAAACLVRARDLGPNFAEVHSDLGNVLREQGLAVEAEASYRRAVQLNPEFAEAHYNLGNILREQARLAEAEASYASALKFRPEWADTCNNLGIVRRELGRHADAEAAYRRAIALKPDYAEAHYNLGIVLAERGRLHEAERCFVQALALMPDYASAHSNLGVTLKQLGRFAEAEASCRRALELRPDHAGAHHNLGIVLRDQGRLDEAEACFRHALRLRPDFADAFGNLLFALNYHPDRSAEDIFKAYREYDARFGMPARSSWRAHANDRNPLRRLRIGYVSPDFRRHSARSFLEPLLANHDKDQVEVFAYAAVVDEDEVTARYRKYADHWIRTNGMTNAEIAQRIRDDRIDILADLAGHTGGNLLGVFALKPAPVSFSWMGYGYTTGLSAIDYFLTDAAWAPPGCEDLFAERPWRLDAPGVVYQPAPGMGEVGALPALARGYMTFGTLTRPIRINHRTIRVWAELLKAVAGSRLVVDSGSYKLPAEQERLASRFADHGIPRERLEIGYHTPPWDVLRGIDIGLDCFPHNSGTTLFESIYMGVPFITLAGRPSVGRLGSCILHSMRRAEWIAESEAEYFAKAAALAADPAGLARIREGLRDEMERSPLRDEPAFARKVEAAYREMFRIWCGKQA